VLWNQPDFAEAESVLEIEYKAHHFKVVFLPKFHCERKFIEMCWGYAKRFYHQKPASTLEADLGVNTFESLAAVALVTMHK
jgi:hypothetical protein